MRQWLRSFLPECPAKDDVLYVACELAANAVQYTRTGRGGWFGVEVIVHDHKAIRVAVADGGGPGTPRIVDEPDCEHGRGLRSPVPRLRYLPAQSVAGLPPRTARIGARLGTGCQAPAANPS